MLLSKSNRKESFSLTCALYYPLAQLVERLSLKEKVSESYSERITVIVTQLVRVSDCESECEDSDSSDHQIFS